MSEFPNANLIVPEDLQKVSGLGLFDRSEISAQMQFDEKAGCSGTVRIPPTPDTKTIVLTGD
jgi:hypothetical protein